MTTTFHHQKTLSQHRENIRTTIHETRLVIGNSLCTTRHLLRAILSIYVSKRSRAREFSTTGRRTFFERSHFPAGRSGTKTHDTHAMLACRELTTRDNAGRPKPTERARKWPNSIRKYYVRRPIDGRGAIDISMLLLILSVGGQTDEN